MTAAIGIKSCIFFNGGLFPEKIVPHQPIIVQHLMKSKIFGPIIQLFTTYTGFASSLRQIYGSAPHSAPSEDSLKITWDAMTHKDGQYLMHKNTNYATARVKNSARLVGAMINASQMMPMMHINGPADSIAGRHMAEEFAARVPEADIIFADSRVGHFPHLEDTDFVVDMLRSFYMMYKLAHPPSPVRRSTTVLEHEISHAL